MNRRSLKKFILKTSNLLVALLLIVQPALAQANPQPDPPGFAQVITRMIPLFVIVFFIFYFLVIRPQEKKLKAQQDMLANLKKGTQVTTTGGIIGRVAGIEKDHILLEVSNNTRVKLEASHIVKVYEPPSNKPGKEKSAA